MEFRDLDRIVSSSPEELSRMSPGELVQVIQEMKTFLYDPLTGLRDRRQFTEGLEFEIQNNTAFVLFDVDNFKQINDAYGHSFGDVILSSVGEILGNNSRCSVGRKSDTIRYGGEEFLVILPSTSIDTAESYAFRILKQVKEKIHLCEEHKKEVIVTLSGGISHFDIRYNPRKDKIEMLKEADLALYLSKRNGKDRVTKFGGELFGNCGAKHILSISQTMPLIPDYFI
jgi:two-component system, cell cycle response regulator